MDSARVTLLRQVLSSTPWVDRTREFARVLRTSTRSDNGLLLVGTPDDEPWHLAAHIDDESRFAGIPELSPVLVRHRVPDGAPAHLAVGLDRLEYARSGETLFVVAPTAAPEGLLDRVDYARGRGATIMSMHSGDADLSSLAHESLILPPQGLMPSSGAWSTALASIDDVSARTALDVDVTSVTVSFDVLEHLVSTAVGETAIVAPVRSNTSRRAFRDRLGRLLDSIAGPTHTE